MPFPFTYKKKLLLPTNIPDEFSEKILHSFCDALNKERKCTAKIKDNVIEFEVSSWDMMSWRVFSFINNGNVKTYPKIKDVEVEFSLNTTLSALVILVLSIVFAIIVNITDGQLNIKEACLSIICAWTFLYFINWFVSVGYFKSLFKVTYKNIS